VSSTPPKDDESGPLNEPTVPTTIGVPVAAELDEPPPETGDDPVTVAVLDPEFELELQATKNSAPITATTAPSLVLGLDCTVPPFFVFTSMHA
jgi:hypothetical protein